MTSQKLGFQSYLFRNLTIKLGFRSYLDSNLIICKHSLTFSYLSFLQHNEWKRRKKLIPRWTGNSSRSGRGRGRGQNYSGTSRIQREDCATLLEPACSTTAIIRHQTRHDHHGRNLSNMLARITDKI